MHTDFTLVVAAHNATFGFLLAHFANKATGITHIAAIYQNRAGIFTILHSSTCCVYHQTSSANIVHRRHVFAAQIRATANVTIIGAFGHHKRCSRISHHSTSRSIGIPRGFNGSICNGRIVDTLGNSQLIGSLCITNQRRGIITGTGHSDATRSRYLVKHQSARRSVYISKKSNRCIA